jgi:hypothetical protein
VLELAAAPVVEPTAAYLPPLHGKATLGRIEQRDKVFAMQRSFWVICCFARQSWGSEGACCMLQLQLELELCLTSSHTVPPT